MLLLPATDMTLEHGVTPPKGRSSDDRCSGRLRARHPGGTVGGHHGRWRELGDLDGWSGPRDLPCGPGVPSVERDQSLSLIHISEPTRRTPISYAVFCLK